MTVYRSTAAIPAVAGRAGFAAAGRFGHAVHALPDSGLVHRLTRGQAWIGVLGALLVGIVALNVLSLSMTTASGETGAQIDELQRSNSALRSEIAETLSAPKVESLALSYGLSRPQADDITYLESKASDLVQAAKVLAGAVLAGTPWAPSSDDETDAAVADTGYTDPAPDPAEPVYSAPAPSTSSPSSTSGSSEPPATTSAPPAAPSSSGGVGAGL
jgi:hypothetical protein